MSTESTPIEEKHQKTKVIRQGGASEAVYGLGMIGAWVYFISHATTFWIGVLGFVRGIFWPAMLVYEVLKHLGM